MILTIFNRISFFNRKFWISTGYQTNLLFVLNNNILLYAIKNEYKCKFILFYLIFTSYFMIYPRFSGFAHNHTIFLVSEFVLSNCFVIRICVYLSLESEVPSLFSLFSKPHSIQLDRTSQFVIIWSVLIL